MRPLKRTSDWCGVVEWKLIEMPLPRLQMMGRSQRPFIYEIYWDQRVEQREVTRYQRGEPSSFDNRVMLRHGVGEYLLQLNGLLRPLIQRRWAAMVAQLNRLEESQLEVFLFGADRTQTAKIRAGLWEIQGRRCFYCDARIAGPVARTGGPLCAVVALPGRRSGQLRRRRQELQRVQEQLAGCGGPPDSVDTAFRRRLERGCPACRSRPTSDVGSTT